MSDREEIDAALREAVEVVVLDMCCASCSTASIPDTTDTYAYYHSQDAERAFSVDGVKPVGESITWNTDDDEEEPASIDSADILVAPLYIGYGTSVHAGEADDSDDVNARITKAKEEIVFRLSRHGFQVDGIPSNDERIKVVGKMVTFVH